jgi:thiol-disulfide isomerase/thioredoxin
METEHEAQFGGGGGGGLIKFIVFLVFAAGGYFGVRHFFFHKGIVPWRYDLEGAKVEASREKKPLLVYFTADWCGPCQHMKATTWSDARVAEALKDYVPVQIDVDDQPNVARTFGVRGIPRVQVMTADGTLGQGLTGAVSPEVMADWLK